MDYLKVHCFHCRGEFELYNRNMNYDDKPPRCPHCLKNDEQNTVGAADQCLLYFCGGQ